MIVVRILFVTIAVGLVSASDVDSALAQEEAPEGVSSTTLVYGAEFIARFPNLVSVLDLIPRIPGAEQILGDPRMQQFMQRRGFSGNEDSVLIDGKRISGKSNDSRSALGRINIDQVERVEIIRGSNPDIKVSSQRGIINVVLKEGVSRGSGAWRAESRTIARTGTARFGGSLSYGGTAGALEYLSQPRWSPSTEITAGRRQLLPPMAVLPSFWTSSGPQTHRRKTGREPDLQLRQWRPAARQRRL